MMVFSWAIVTNSKSTSEKQLMLINQATALVNDGIYIRAVPLLEEAAGYDAAHTVTAENELKRVYLALIENRGFPRKYITLLEKQMNRRDADASVFIEAANYYLSSSKLQDALAILRTGIDKTGDAALVTLYEGSRYAYETHRTSYDNIAMIYNQHAQVLLDGKRGIVNTEGLMIIPCEYEKISTFCKDRAIVMKEGIIYAVDKNNNRIAVTYDDVSDFGNLAENRIPLLIDGNWRRASGDFELGTSAFEDFGMYCGGYAAARVDGKWGVIDLSSNWLIPPEYDGIVQDELGRCYAQGVVFVRSGGYVYLMKDGIQIGAAYDDAQPFSDEGYAAVKRNGRWGFIDASGAEVLPFAFDDALSFGQHLAAVRHGEYWGYINIYGHIVIDTVFYEAKSFSGGSAPVLTERGWQLITLLEFKKGASL